MKNRILNVVLLFLLAGSIYGQDLVMPDLPGYKKIVNYPVYNPGNLWDFIDGAAESYISYGFVDLHVAEYRKGKNTIKLEIYRHSDHTQAFGIYSTERSPTFRFINLGAQGYEVDGAINFFKGDYYVKIRTYSKSEKTIQSAESLAQIVANMVKGDSKMPEILSRFPGEAKKINEETYINESVLGHKFLNKAFRATYQIGSDNFSVFIIDSKSSEEAMNNVNSYLKAAGIDAVDSGSGKYMLTDGYNGTIFLAWKGTRVVIISGLSKDQADIADQYSSEILL